MLSPSSDYIALRNEDSVRLFHGDKLLWTRLTLDPATKLLGLGNNGSLLLHKEGRIMLFFQDGEHKVMLEDDDTIQANKAILDAGGHCLCVETSFSTSTGEKKKTGFFFKSKGFEDTSRFHKILTYDSVSNEQNEIWDFERDTSIESSLDWDISRDLTLLAIAETIWQERPARSMVTRLYLINLREDKTLFQMTLPHVKVKAISLNMKGMLLLDLLDEHHRFFHIINKEGEKSFVNPPMKDLRLLHFGNESVIFQVFPDRIIMFKDLRDNLVYLLDERIFESLGIEYPLLFRTNDDIILPFFDEQKSILKRYNLSWRGNKMDFIYHK